VDGGCFVQNGLPVPNHEVRTADLWMQARVLKGHQEEHYLWALMEDDFGVATAAAE